LINEKSEKYYPGIRQEKLREITKNFRVIGVLAEIPERGLYLIQFRSTTAWCYQFQVFAFVPLGISVQCQFLTWLLA
jgi:hypothetical protein